MFHVKHLDGLTPEVQQKLDIYQGLLFKWQKAVNLVSGSTLDDFWNRHIIDSLQILPYINGEKILDVGSGGGFPGMVLAIATDLEVTCVDSDAKKMLFLSEVARQTNTKVNLITDRIENIKPKDFDTVCARGFSSLKNLLQITLDRGQCGVFLKGAKINDEIQEAKKSFDFQYETHSSKTDSRGCIITVNHISRRSNV